jgi:hypothetical protein
LILEGCVRVYVCVCTNGAAFTYVGERGGGERGGRECVTVLNLERDYHVIVWFAEKGGRRGNEHFFFYFVQNFFLLVLLSIDNLI